MDRQAASLDNAFGIAQQANAVAEPMLDPEERSGSRMFSNTNQEDQNVSSLDRLMNQNQSLV
jgi:hypothetical protein